MTLTKVGVGAGDVVVLWVQENAGVPGMRLLVLDKGRVLFSAIRSSETGDNGFTKFTGRYERGGSRRAAHSNA